jgi:rare lipoprotein A
MIARSLAAIFCCLIAAGPLTGAANAETGIASVYGYDGQKTANGERANPRAMTAAHKSLPFGTMVTVVNKSNGREVTVRINDRGPFIRGRIIDLTPAAASQLGFSGLAPVRISVNGG